MKLNECSFNLNECSINLKVSFKNPRCNQHDHEEGATSSNPFEILLFWWGDPLTPSLYSALRHWEALTFLRRLCHTTSNSFNWPIQLAINKLVRKLWAGKAISVFGPARNKMIALSHNMWTLILSNFILYSINVTVIIYLWSVTCISIYVYDLKALCLGAIV